MTRSRHRLRSHSDSLGRDVILSYLAPGLPGLLPGSPLIDAIAHCDFPRHRGDDDNRDSRDTTNTPPARSLATKVRIPRTTRTLATRIAEHASLQNLDRMLDQRRSAGFRARSGT